jgi:DNA-binding NtrC family response regulator
MPDERPDTMPDAVLEALLLESAVVGGTLFLEDLEALASRRQAMLWQVLTEKRLEVAGGSRSVPVDLRVVAANRRPLAEAVAAGRFRPDLADAFGATAIVMPPLRERIEDLPLLVQHFLDRARVERGTCVKRFADAALERLMDHDWPGNVAELEDLTERLARDVRTEEIAVDDLPEAYTVEPAFRTWAPRVPATGLDFNDVVERFENDLIAQALARTHWNKNRAARLLGLNRTTLVEKIKKRGLKPPASMR